VRVARVELNLASSTGCSYVPRAPPLQFFHAARHFYEEGPLLRNRHVDSVRTGYEPLGERRQLRHTTVLSSPMTSSPRCLLRAERLSDEPPAHQRSRGATKLKPVGSIAELDAFTRPSANAERSNVRPLSIPPPSPVPRSAFVVLDGKDENALLLDPIDHVVRKAGHPSLAVLAAEGRTRLRKTLGSSRRPPRPGE
jgi:hypothetical protein